MRDYTGSIKAGEKEYPIIFNLNVMETIQEEYGSVDEWGKMTDSTADGINVKALVFGITEMMNEAVDIANDTAETKQPFYTHKQVGRILTSAGIGEAAKAMNKTVVEASKSDADEKNV